MSAESQTKESCRKREVLLFDVFLCRLTFKERKSWYRHLLSTDSQVVDIVHAVRSLKRWTNGSQEFPPYKRPGVPRRTGYAAARAIERDAYRYAEKWYKAAVKRRCKRRKAKQVSPCVDEFNLDIAFSRTDHRFGLSVRALTVLTRLGFNTWRNLVQDHTVYDLLNVKGCGAKTLKEITDFLGDHKLQLKEKPDRDMLVARRDRALTIMQGVGPAGITSADMVAKHGAVMLWELSELRGKGEVRVEEPQGPYTWRRERWFITETEGETA